MRLHERLRSNCRCDVRMLAESWKIMHGCAYIRALTTPARPQCRAPPAGTSRGRLGLVRCRRPCRRPGCSSGGGPGSGGPVMAESGIGTLRIPSPHRGGSRGPVRLLAIGQPPGLPALPDQGPLLRVPPRGGRHPSNGRIMHPAGASRSRCRSAGLCRRAPEPIRHER
jgi:hypothetical protein